jgi:hypothetical protein
MKHSYFWEADMCSAGQEIPCILWNPKVYEHVYKNLPLNPILSQLNTFNTTISYVFKINYKHHLNKM